MLCVDNFYTGGRRTSSRSWSSLGRVDASRRDPSALRRGRRDLQTCPPASPIHYQRDLVQTTNQRARRHQHARSCGDALLRLLPPTPDAHQGLRIFNTYGLRELAKTILSLTGSTSTLEFRPLPSDDPQMRRPDISLAVGEVGWMPYTPLAEGLARTIDCFKSIVNGTSALNLPEPGHGLV